MVFRKLGNLITLPNLTIAGGLVKEDEWPSPTVCFIKDFTVVDANRRHLSLAHYSLMNSRMSR
jgi:hypothetical protein